MAGLGIFCNALKLLSPRDRSLIGLAALAQVALSLLDVLGILLIGLVVAVIAAASTGAPLGFAAKGLAYFGLNETPDLRTLAILTAVAGAALIGKSVSSLYLTRRSYRFLANRQAALSGDLAARFLESGMSEVTARSSQQTAIALTAGMGALTQMVLGQGIVLIGEGALVLVLVGGLLLVDPVVTAFAVVYFGLIGAVLQLALGRWARRLGAEATDAESKSLASLQEATAAYREMKVGGRTQLFISKFQEQRWRVARVSADTFILGQAGKYVFEIGLVVGGGLLVGAMAISRDVAASLAILAVFLAATARIFPSLLRIQAAFVNIRNAEGSSATALELAARLDTTQPDRSSPPLEVLLRPREAGSYRDFVPTIDVSEVSVVYPGSVAPALSGVSVTMPVGSSLALVGASGAGKSTLADVILGVLQPTRGSVLVSGMQPKEVIKKWPGAMAYVPQDVTVLEGSVRRNIAFGLPETAVNDGLVIEALERARLWQFLRDERAGLDTVVGEKGVRLSGGQRQRLGIARALYTQPQLIVLDEATSALDAQTEREVTATLDELSRQVTLILIAHRLATVMRCDQVAYLERGRVIALGTFSQVRAQVPNFDRQASLLGL